MTPIEECPPASQYAGPRTGEKASDPVFLLAIPCFLYYLIFYVLPPPLPIRVESNLLDPSWRIILTDAFLRGTQFGRDLVYTYGPWGFIENTQGDPRIYPWAVAARLLIALAFACGLSVIIARTVRSKPGRALLLAWIALLSDPVYVLPMVLLGVASLPDREKDRMQTAIVHLAAIACALTMWIKFTSFVTVSALAVALAAQAMLSRRLSLIPLEIAAAAPAFWVLARQSLFSLPAFLHGALSTASSYSSEIPIPGEYAELPYVAVLLAAVALSALLVFRNQRPWPLWPTAGWVALLFFLQGKEAFVRYDSFHVWMGIVNALLPCVLILVCRMGCFERAAGIPTHVCAAIVILASLTLMFMEVQTKAGFERYQWLSRNMKDLQTVILGSGLDAAYREQLAEFRRTAPLRKVSGTAEFFPDDQVLLYGNGLQVRTPPIPQSFEAYNAYLSGRNAAFFRSARRPDFVFFDIAPIDRRYPTAADPLSWLALLDCYVPDGYSGNYLVLRAAGCVPESLDLLKETIARAGVPIHVPATNGEAVWAEIDMRPNRAGTILATLARPAATQLRVLTANGEKSFSLTSQTARMGFLLSPLLSDASSFEHLYSGGNADVVRSIEIVQSARAQEFYESAIGVRFYKITLKRFQPGREWDRP